MDPRVVLFWGGGCGAVEGKGSKMTWWDGEIWAGSCEQLLQYILQNQCWCSCSYCCEEGFSDPWKGCIDQIVRQNFMETHHLWTGNNSKNKKNSNSHNRTCPTSENRAKIHGKKNIIDDSWPTGQAPIRTQQNGRFLQSLQQQHHSH